MREFLAASSRRSELSRFIIVGLFSNALGFCIYLLLTYIGIPSKAAMTAMYAISVYSGYLGNLRFTFASRTVYGNVVPRYLAAHLLGYLVNLGIHFLGGWLGLPHQLSQAVGIGIVAILLFFLFRNFVFKVATVSRIYN